MIASVSPERSFGGIGSVNARPIASLALWHDEIMIAGELRRLDQSNIVDI
ncbi:MAG TPA: hypothetical protein VI195_01480 [Steroidobacteraceae bacterium]